MRAVMQGVMRRDANHGRWTKEQVIARIREAWDTLRRVPVAGVPGYRCQWPDVVQDYFDAYGQTAERLRLSPASPRAIDRMHEAFGWFKFLEDRTHLTKAVWFCCGAGMGPARAGDILGVHRNTVRSRRDEGVIHIVEGLNRLDT